MIGPVIPINVCFNEDGSLNEFAVSDYVDWLCEQQAGILLLTYGSSEFASLSDAEIWKLTETVARANGGRLLFIASTGFWKPSVSREFLQHADAIGADAVKIQIANHGSDYRDINRRYFDQIAGTSDIPLLLWKIGGQPLPVYEVAMLAERPNIIGMKNDGDPFYEYYDLIRATRDKEFGVISGGLMRNFMLGYPIGSPAYLCPIAPFRPTIARHFYALLVSGRAQEAWRIVFEYEDPWFGWASEHDWMACRKSAIQLLGIYPNNLLGPPKPAPPAKLLEEVRLKLDEVFAEEAR
jgi:dihydrodipicolinate synthase/N-acetylneuraminate lyase